MAIEVRGAFESSPPLPLSHLNCCAPPLRRFPAPPPLLEHPQKISRAGTSRRVFPPRKFKASRCRSRLTPPAQTLCSPPTMASFYGSTSALRLGQRALGPRAFSSSASASKQRLLIVGSGWGGYEVRRSFLQHFSKLHCSPNPAGDAQGRPQRLRRYPWFVPSALPAFSLWRD